MLWANLGRKHSLNKISILILGIFFEVVLYFTKLDSVFLPRPSAVLLRLAELSIDQLFLTDILHSFLRLLVGGILAIPVGLFFALALHGSRIFSFWVEPILNASYPLPKVALFPLLLVFFGIGESAKIAMIFLGFFYAVVINALAGFQRLDAEGYVGLAGLYRINFLQYTYQILIKGALPEILVGMKLGIGYGLTMTIVSEFSLSETGLGVRLWNSWDAFRVIDIYVCLFVIGAIGLAASSLMNQLQKRLLIRNAKI